MSDKWFMLEGAFRSAADLRDEAARCQALADDSSLAAERDVFAHLAAVNRGRAMYEEAAALRRAQRT